jgi:isopenicillin N synthase-like dioxygenase
MSATTQTVYAPPPGPPPKARTPPQDPRPPLLPTSSKLDLNQLSSQGWLSIPLDEYPEIRDTYSSLFSLSEKYFALPDEDAAKTDYAAPSGAQASEEGYSRIQGEKQILTCRSESRTPLVLQDGVREAWAASGLLLKNTAEDIACSLGLPPDTYSSFVDPCITFRDEKTPTLLRMFRYERPPIGSEPTVVAQSHRDLGMLTVVIGHTPGLDVLEPPSAQYPEGRWISIEESPAVNSSPNISPGRTLTATLLNGQVMNYLTQGRYRPGYHRVSVRPAEDTPFRFSLVFALRPAPAPVHTARYESPQTGPFPPGAQMDGESMGLLFERIVNSHWNINVHKDIREAQQRKFEEMKAAREAEMAKKFVDSGPAPSKSKRFSRVLRLIGKK